MKRTASELRGEPWIPLALASKCGLDFAQAARLTGKSRLHFRAFGLYCLVTALSTLLVFPLVPPEGKTAWNKLRSKG